MCASPVLATTEIIGNNIELVRSPTEVYSNQPVLILAHIPNSKNVELEITINIIAKTNVSDLTPPTLTIPTYRIRMVPIPWAKGWYIIQIPGLPSKTWVFNVKLLLRTITVKFTITSEVAYKLIIDGKVVASDDYIVKEGEILQHLPPFAYTFIYDVLNDPSIINETLGLGPHGWVIGDGESVKVMIIAFDEKSQPEINFEYRVSDRSWVSTLTSDSSIMDKLSSLVNDVNEAISTLEDWIKQYKHDIAIPRAKLTIKIAEATIPAQSAGTYVLFRTTAIDADGNTIVSPTGFYHVTNKASATRILIIDPHVWLWLLKESMEHLLNTLKTNIDYEFPTEVIAPLKHVEETSKTIVDYGLEQFHHWEYLSKHYNIYITWPNEDVANLLDNLKPNVIILSNLGLGLENGGLWNWDLRDITVNDESLLEHLITYIKQSHAGLIATHATLSDEIVWLSCKEKQKIGARGHVGYDLEDIDINDEQTVAALLGMPELALWEYMRDKVAETLCTTSSKDEAMLIGSIPLQVPHVPWNGVLKLTPEAKDLGWNLPEEFTIEIPTLAETYGFKAYTEIGWQLALPRTLAYTAWNKAFDARANFAKLRNKLASFYRNIAGNTVETTKLNDYLDKALEHVLKDYYKAISTAQIRSSLMKTSIPIPERNKPLSITIDLGSNTLTNLLQKLPVKIVALSPKGLAGIVTYDKFWDSNGYRSVYFSFEVEAAKGDIVEKILVNAVEWVKKWQYKDIMEFLGNLLVSKELALRFKNTVTKTPGKEIFSNGLILNEEGSTNIELNIEPGKLYLIIAHPTTDKVQISVSKGAAKITNIVKIDEHLSQAIVKVSSSGALEISLRAGSEASLNPIYLTIKFEAYTPTVTTTTTTQTATTTTAAETTTSATTTSTTYTTQTTYTPTTSQATESSPTITSTETTPLTTISSTTSPTSVTSATPTTTYTPYESKGVDYTLLYAGLAIAVIVAGILIGLARRR